jgi:hypothetical protein
MRGRYEGTKIDFESDGAPRASGRGAENGAVAIPGEDRNRGILMALPVFNSKRYLNVLSPALNRCSRFQSRARGPDPVDGDRLDERIAVDEDDVLEFSFLSAKSAERRAGH